MVGEELGTQVWRRGVGEDFDVGAGGVLLVEKRHCFGGGWWICCWFGYDAGAAGKGCWVSELLFMCVLVFCGMAADEDDHGVRRTIVEVYDLTRAPRH